MRSIHEEYLQAGAEIIESNTFGANALRLDRYGFRTRCSPSTAREPDWRRQAVKQLTEKQSGEAWVAGSIGPLGVRSSRWASSPGGGACRLYRTDSRLAEGGVDLLAIETICALNEAEQALLAAAGSRARIPVLAMVTVDEEGNCLDGSSLETRRPG